MNNFGWIELVFFYGIAIGFGLWQYVSVSRTLEKTRAERRAREEAEAAKRDEEPPID